MCVDRLDSVVRRIGNISAICAEVPNRSYFKIVSRRTKLKYIYIKGDGSPPLYEIIPFEINNEITFQLISFILFVIYIW